MHVATFVFGALAVVALWVAIRLVARLRGRPWYEVVARMVGAVALIAFGVLMIFYAAFE